MSRIIGVTLLLIIVADNVFDSTAARAQFQVSKVHIRKCGCAFLNGEIKCVSSLFPTKQVMMQDLVKCLCRMDKHKFPKFKACRSWLFGIPISLA